MCNKKMMRSFTTTLSLFLLICSMSLHADLAKPTIPVKPVKPIGTLISTLPYEITTSGYYYLSANLFMNNNSASTDAVTIKASSVVVDFNGFTLVGMPNVDVNGIKIAQRTHNIEIRNGQIEGFGHSAILSDDVANKGITIKNIKFIANGRATRGDRTIQLAGDNHTVEHCTVLGTTQVGINLTGYQVVVKNNNVAGSISTSNGGNVLNNVAWTIYNNANNGITSGNNVGSINAGGQIIDNISTGMISALPGSLVKNNSASRIECMAGACNIVENVVNGSIRVLSGTNIINNKAESIIADGGSGNYIKDNHITPRTSSSSSSYGIATTDDGNFVEGNFISGFHIGINFGGNRSKTYYKNNKITNCVNPYINQQDAIDGGGNIAF